MASKNDSKNYINGDSKWGIGKLKYGTTLFGCQSHVAHALWGLGVPTLPINIHPMVLYSQFVAVSSTFTMQQAIAPRNTSWPNAGPFRLFKIVPRRYIFSGYF